MTADTGKNIKNIFSLSIPIIVENLLQTLLGVTDTYFAGKIADIAIAGIGVTNLVMNILIAFFTALTVGTVAITARNYGRKDYKRVNSSIMHPIVLGIALGVVSGAVCVLFRTPILHITGADSSIIPYAMPYYIIVAGPCVFLCLQLILSSCLRAVEDTKTPMYVTVATNIIKILLTMLFVKMGMGIFGLGLATTLSRVIGTVVLLVCLQRHDKNISLSFCKLTGKEFSPILRIGIPAGMEKLIMKMGQLIYIGMVIRLGTSAYVAHNIASNIDNLAWSCAMGFGLAACTMVGISLGQDNIEQAKKLTTTANFISVITLSVIGVFIFIFARQLAAIFTKTEELQDIIVPILRIVAIIQPFSALLQNMTSVLQGAGDTKFPMYSTFVGIWGIRDCIGFLFAVYFNMGLIGCWFAYSLDVVIRGVLLLLRFNRGKWQKIKI